MRNELLNFSLYCEIVIYVSTLIFFIIITVQQGVWSCVHGTPDVQKCHQKLDVHFAFVAIRGLQSCTLVF